MLPCASLAIRTLRAGLAAVAREAAAPVEACADGLGALRVDRHARELRAVLPNRAVGVAGTAVALIGGERHLTLVADATVTVREPIGAVKLADAARAPARRILAGLVRRGRGYLRHDQNRNREYQEHHRLSRAHVLLLIVFVRVFCTTNQPHREANPAQNHKDKQRVYGFAPNQRNK